MKAPVTIGERTEAGLEFRLRPRGPGRFFSIAFLTVWLCGWAVGESFALWFLLRGAVAVATGQPSEVGREALPWGPALIGGVFLLLWLTLWTLGGILALRELLRALAGEDRVIVGGGELIHEGRLGPFRSRRVIAGTDITGVRISGRRGALVVDTTDTSREISRLGSREEREAAADLLRRELSIEGRTQGPSLPAGWQEILTPEGTTVLVPDPVRRSKDARALGVVALVLATGSLLLFRAALAAPGLWPLTILGAVATAGLIWGTVWLAQGRIEWRIGSGRIVRQRRFRDQVREQFEATALELTSTSDSDGDEWISVEALAPEAVAMVASGAPRRFEQWKHRRCIHKTMGDDATPRRIALWLAERAGLPLADRTTAEARSAEIAALRAQLEASGRLGQVIARLIDRPSPTSSSR